MHYKNKNIRKGTDIIFSFDKYFVKKLKFLYFALALN